VLSYQPTEGCSRGISEVGVSTGLVGNGCQATLIQSVRVGRQHSFRLATTAAQSNSCFFFVLFFLLASHWPTIAKPIICNEFFFAGIWPQTPEGCYL